jgi:hypothetical protein
MVELQPLKMGLIGCPDTSVSNDYLLHNEAKAHISYLIGGRSLKSHEKTTC